MNNSPIDPDFIRPAGSGTPTPRHDAIPTPVPPVTPPVQATTTEEPVVEETPSVIEESSDTHDAVSDEPPTEDASDDTPPTEPGETVSINDPETYVRNRTRFENGDIPGVGYDSVFLIKDDIDTVLKQIMDLELAMGTEDFLKEVMKADSPTNILYRFVFENYSESYRVQALLSKLPKEVLDTLSAKWTDPKNPKRTLRIYGAKESVPDGNTVVDSDDAYERMMAMDGVSRNRCMLYESGLCLELLVPQNSDFDTLFNMLAQDEITQYVDIGLEVYDLIPYRLKEITLTWLRAFIAKCTLRGWQKPGILEDALTNTDFNVLVTYLAHLCYPTGFDRFIDKCLRPISKDYPTGCSYEKRLTITPGDLIVTRFSVMTEAQLNYMFDRLSFKQNTLAQVNDYKKSFDMFHQVIQHRGWTLTLDVPNIKRYFAAGQAAYTASASVIQAGNVPGVFEDMASKGYQSVATYVSAITRTEGAKSMTTTNTAAIMKLVGRICDEDERICDPDKPEEFLVPKIQDFISQCQLTYVGFQTKPCSECGYVNPNTNGWAGIDGLRLFFTIGRSLR